MSDLASLNIDGVEIRHGESYVLKNVRLKCEKGMILLPEKLRRISMEGAVGNINSIDIVKDIMWVLIYIDDYSFFCIDSSYFWKYFYTTKEARKLKLEKITCNL